MHHRTLTILLRVALATSPCLFLAACGPSEYSKARTPIDASEPTRAIVLADWNDVEAAVENAVIRAELAPLSTTPRQDPGGRRRFEFTFLATDDSRMTLLVTQGAAGAGERAPGDIELEATTRPRRDAKRERALVDGVVKRLRALTNVDFAPLEIRRSPVTPLSRP